MSRRGIKQGKALLVFFLILTCCLAAAEEQKTKTYSSSTSFSALLTSGNSSEVTLGFDTNHHLDFIKDSFNLKSQMIYSRTDNQKATEIFSAALEYKRQFNQRLSLFTQAAWSRNVPAGFKSRLELHAGLGYVWHKSSKITLSSDVAMGWNAESNVEKFGGLILPVTETFASAIMMTKLEIRLSSSAELLHQENLLFNLKRLEGYRIQSLTSLSVAISEHFALKTSIQIFYENTPVPGYEKTDLFILSSIVFKI